MFPVDHITNVIRLNMMHFCRKSVCFATMRNFGSQKIATEAAAAVNAKTTTHSIAIKLNSTFKVILEDTKSKVESGRRLHQIHKAIYVIGSIREPVRKKIRDFLGVFPKCRIPPHPPYLGGLRPKKKLRVYFAV